MEARFWGPALLWAVAVTTGVQAATAVCTRTGSGAGEEMGCELPACPPGTDCAGPEIDFTDSEVKFSDPLLRWSAPCPDVTVGPACWEAYVDATASFTANDPSGVDAVGLELAVETGRRVVRRVWARNPPRDSRSRSQFRGTLSTYLPAAGELRVVTLGLCARDKKGNERCRDTSRRKIIVDSSVEP